MSANKSTSQCKPELPSIPSSSTSTTPLSSFPTSALATGLELREMWRCLLLKCRSRFNFLEFRSWKGFPGRRLFLPCKPRFRTFPTNAPPNAPADCPCPFPCPLPCPCPCPCPCRQSARPVPPPAFGDDIFLENSWPQALTRLRHSQ